MARDARAASSVHHCCPGLRDQTYRSTLRSDRIWVSVTNWSVDRCCDLRLPQQDLDVQQQVSMPTVAPRCMKVSPVCGPVTWPLSRGGEVRDPQAQTFGSSEIGVLRRSSSSAQDVVYFIFDPPRISIPALATVTEEQASPCTEHKPVEQGSSCRGNGTNRKDEISLGR